MISCSVYLTFTTDDARRPRVKLVNHDVQLPAIPDTTDAYIDFGNDDDPDLQLQVDKVQFRAGTDEVEIYLCEDKLASHECSSMIRKYKKVGFEVVDIDDDEPKSARAAAVRKQ